MRILIANCHRDIVGGTEKYLQSLIPALGSAGHEVGLVYEYGPVSGGPSIDPAEAGLPAWSREELSDAAAWQQLERWNPSVVYLNGLESNDLENSLLDRYPAVFFGHGYYGTCGTGRKCHAFPDVRPCSRSFGPACLLLHYPRRCGGLNPLSTLHIFRQQGRRKSFLPRYRAVLVASQHMWDEYANNGVAAERLHKIPLFTTEIQPQREPRRARRVPQGILMISRLTNLKGGDYLLKSLPLAEQMLGRNLSITVAGSGPELPKLQELASDLRVKAEFTGWVDAARQLELMRAADLLAVPSLWPEPFGMVGLEAGCTGLPAIGYDNGGISEWLVPGRSGELAAANPPTPGGLAQAIVRALTDPNHYGDLCQGAWETARQFTAERHLSMLEPILEESSHRHSSLMI